MTRSQLITAVAARSGLPQQIAAQAVNMVLDSMADALIQGRRIEIRGMGSFKVKTYEGRVAHNPRTGAPVPVETTVRPTFRMGKEIRDRLNENLQEDVSEPSITEWEE